MTKTATTVSLIAGALALGVSTSALYAQSGSEDATELTLTEAIAIAEAETGGAAIEAEWEMEDGVRLIEVAVLDGSDETELTIDPVTGEVLSMELEDDDMDDDEHDDEEDEDDDDEYDHDDDDEDEDD